MSWAFRSDSIHRAVSWDESWDERIHGSRSPKALAERFRRAVGTD